MINMSIGGADGPTVVFLAGELGWTWLGTLLICVIIFGINSVLMRRIKESLCYAGVTFVGYVACKLYQYFGPADIRYGQAHGILVQAGQVLLGAIIGFVLGALITKKIGEKPVEESKTVIIKRTVLRVIAFIMFAVAVVFLIAAFSNPTLTFPDIGPFKPEPWMLWIFYALYVIVMSVIFTASFFVKDKKY